MNQVRRKTPTSLANPRSVLHSISAANGFDLHAASFSGTPSEATELQEFPVESISDIATDHPEVAENEEEVISLRINPATHRNQEVDDVLESTYESAKQIQELAARLNDDESRLQAREKELEDRIQQLDQTHVDRQSEVENRLSQLQQQASHVRCQQLHLMQLQTDIVKSHEATRLVIAQLVAQPTVGLRTVAALETLKQQLGGRFDYITRRWEHLSELMKDVRAQNVAREAINDVVDWNSN